MASFSFEDTSKPFIYRSTANIIISRLHGEEAPIHPQREFQRKHLSSENGYHYGDCAQSDLIANRLDRLWTKRDTGSNGTIDEVTGKHQDKAQTTLSPNPNVTEIDKKVICYLWEVTKQNTYLHERQKYRFQVIPDGNCLYRAVSRAAYGDQSMHKELREQTMHHIADHLEDFNSIIEGDIGEFLISASQEGVWAGYPELLAMSKFLNVNIYLTTGGSFESPTVSSMVHFLGEEDTTKPVIWLSWLSNGHYDVVLNCCVPNPEYDEWCEIMHQQKTTDEELAKSIVT
ncbi:OTU domain-containing protein 1 [Clupea harengus]|uniref:OTU domain-containing protein 1 n=1 Tax=Clupea harengus TaxID=7950 RepID=A0A8M1KX58_CLUHA|nr:OTU domain-containing protein 1 [Clupea harengus]